MEEMTAKRVKFYNEYDLVMLPKKPPTTRKSLLC